MYNQNNSIIFMFEYQAIKSQKINNYIERQEVNEKDRK
jgi:hypothetical protein